MKKRTLSRRKFLTGLGVATAGTAALAPALKLENSLKGKRNLVSAWTKPQLPKLAKEDLFFTNTKVRHREAGSHLLPLDRRPV